MVASSSSRNAPDPGRIQALHDLEILDTEREAAFDRITGIAGQLFSVDMACITLVDESRFFFKSSYGCDVVEAPLESGLCDITVKHGRTRVVPDTLVDTETKDHSMVLGQPHVRFYAGAPLITPAGQAIGTLCLMHSQTLPFSDHDAAMLGELASYVMLHMVKRKEAAQTQRAGLALLAGGVAHDLNNYLIGISGNASLIRDIVGNDPRLNGRFDAIVEATARAKDLTNQLMIYAGQRKPACQVLDVCELALDVIRLQTEGLPGHVTLQHEFEADSFFVEADPTQIRQVFVNLISNAIESCHQAPGKIRVRLYRCQHGHLCIEVSDNGIGMDEDTQASLFAPFFSTKLPGRGLGMSIVDQVVGSHEGRVMVDSAPGVGSTITVALPLKHVQGGETNAHSAVALAPKLQPRRVLIVDDEKQIRDFLQFAGEHLGLDVRVAVSGENALRILADEGLPDLIMIDVGMPGMSGDEALAAIQARFGDVDAVVMSGHDLSDVRPQFRQCKVKAFIQKPFGLDTLEAVVNAPRALDET